LPLKPEGGLRKLKNKLLNFLIALFVLVILLSLGLIFVFYNPSVVTDHFKKDTSGGSSVSQGLPPPEVEPEVEEDAVPPEVEARVKELASVIDGYFVRLKCGIEKKPALVLKAVPKGEWIELYLLTLYPMEWPFTKLELRFGSFSPGRVYACRGGVLVVRFKLRGLYPPEVSRGELDQFGVLVVPEERFVEVYPFKEGECTKNGFVFNLAGDFVGVCFGGEFVSARELYEEVPGSCKIIYKSERG